jgi:hypothetical protein
VEVEARPVRPARRRLRLKVPGLKVAVPLPAEAPPRDLVPADGPPGEPTLDLVLEGGSLAARARLNGRNYRRMLKQVDEQGAANVAVFLQGVLRPPPAPGEPYVLEGAGFQLTVTTPKPAPPAPEQPPG